MDDSFAFRGIREPRRLDPRALRLGALAFVMTLVVGLFAHWAITSEHASFRRLSAENVAASSRQVAAAQAAPSPAPVLTLSTADPGDLTAQHTATTIAHRAAKILRRTGSFAGAGPASLTEPGTPLLFVDGPSTTPQIVSVAANDTSWAAAVMSASGTCFYVTVAASGTERFGSGAACTGADALSAHGSRW
jgi:hypothetical protein